MHVISITSCSAFGVGHLVLFCCLNLESVVHVISITCCSAFGVGHLVLFMPS